jgi:hypothetical protein
MQVTSAVLLSVAPSLESFASSRQCSDYLCSRSSDSFRHNLPHSTARPPATHYTPPPGHSSPITALKATEGDTPYSANADLGLEVAATNRHSRARTHLVLPAARLLHACEAYPTTIRDPDRPSHAFFGAHHNLLFIRSHIRPPTTHSRLAPLAPFADQTILQAPHCLHLHLWLTAVQPFLFPPQLPLVLLRDLRGD